MIEKENIVPHKRRDENCVEPFTTKSFNSSRITKTPYTPCKKGQQHKKLLEQCLIQSLSEINRSDNDNSYQLNNIGNETLKSVRNNDKYEDQLKRDEILENSYPDKKIDSSKGDESLIGNNISDGVQGCQQSGNNLLYINGLDYVDGGTYNNRWAPTTNHWNNPSSIEWPYPSPPQEHYESSQIYSNSPPGKRPFNTLQRNLIRNHQYYQQSNNNINIKCDSPTTSSTTTTTTNRINNNTEVRSDPSKQSGQNTHYNQQSYVQAPCIFPIVASNCWNPMRPDLQLNHQYQSEMNLYSYPFYPPIGYFAQFSMGPNNTPDEATRDRSAEVRLSNFSSTSTTKYVPTADVENVSYTAAAMDFNKIGSITSGAWNNSLDPSTCHLYENKSGLNTTVPNNSICPDLVFIQQRQCSQQPVLATQNQYYLNANTTTTTTNTTPLHYQKNKNYSSSNNSINAATTTAAVSNRQISNVNRNHLPTPLIEGHGNLYHHHNHHSNVGWLPSGNNMHDPKVLFNTNTNWKGSGGIGNTVGSKDPKKLPFSTAPSNNHHLRPKDLINHDNLTNLSGSLPVEHHQPKRKGFVPNQLSNVRTKSCDDVMKKRSNFNLNEKNDSMVAAKVNSVGVMTDNNSSNSTSSPHNKVKGSIINRNNKTDQGKVRSNNVKSEGERSSSTTKCDTNDESSSSSSSTACESDVDTTSMRARTLKTSTRELHPSIPKIGGERESIVIYWMARELRTLNNHSLAYAQATAEKWNVPFIVYLAPLNSPYSNLRQQDWRIRGLVDVQKCLQEANVDLVCEKTTDWSLLRGMLKQYDAISIVIDHFPLSPMSAYKNEILKFLPPECSLEEVDAHNVVPSWIASSKTESRAYSFRQLLCSKVSIFKLSSLPAPLKYQIKSLLDKDIFKNKFIGTMIESKGDVLSLLDLDFKKYEEVVTVDWVIPGQDEGYKLIEDWCNHRLYGYSKCRNNPHLNTSCNFSIYFNHGFISAQYCLLRFERANARPIDVDAFTNDFLTWKEFSDNFTLYNPDYDQYSSFPIWAKPSLEEHECDDREYIYTQAEFESHQTHDRLWNACMKEYIMFGKMHSSLRLYWGKMILEWSENAAKALKIAVYLTNKWGLDGSDPISYSDCAWSIGGALDRAFPVRPIYGKVRCITIRGIAKKLDIEKWCEKVERAWEAYKSAEPEVRELYKLLYHSDERSSEFRHKRWS